MCRKREMNGVCLITLGLGLILGVWIGSWFWCGLGGAALILFGISVLQGR